MSLRSSQRLPWFLVVAAAALIAAQWATAPLLCAQTFDATNLRQPTEMGMTWLIHAGDDPAYAQPDFDDSHWTRFDPNTSIKTLFPKGRQPIVWYRLHVRVAPDETGLALEEWNLSSAFEIYVNGQKLISVGRVAPFVPSTFDAHLFKRIPQASIATGSLVIALRVYNSPLDWANAAPGLYAPNLTLGQESALRDRNWLTVIGDNALGLFCDVTGLGLGIVALALFAAQRRRREYLWMFLVFVASALLMPLQIYRWFHTLPAQWGYVPPYLQAAFVIFLILMFFAILQIRLGRWIQIILAVLVVTTIFSSIGIVRETGSWPVVLLAESPFEVIAAGIIPGVLMIHAWRGNREAGILLLPVLLFSLSVYVQVASIVMSQIPALAHAAIRLVSVFFASHAGPFALSGAEIGRSLFNLSLAVIIVLRATRVTRQQAVLEGELAAAREVQHVILPEQIETAPGFKVETIYQPAEQVGGDFFQILPAGEGGMLAVIGDVAGKGLPAAMLVSMLVGAVRTAAHYTSDPSELLAELNERLVGRAGGFSTALATRIDAEGLVALASAGHLPPYLDGKEIELPSALPLGVKAGARYQTVRFRIDTGSRLTFYSDGIVEAKKQSGEMFGFERARELSTRPAAAIVAAARQFGQQDDMTVVSIERAPAAVSAAEFALEPAPAPVV